MDKTNDVTETALKESVLNKKRKSKKNEKKQGKSGEWNILKALNEKIVGMGYSYSLISFFKNFFIFSIFIVIMGYYHQMKPIYIIVIIAFYFLLLPFSIYSQYKYLYEQKRFEELCTYMKQMKINFKTHKKILRSLEETIDNFEESDRIYPYMKKAIKEIKKGTGYREALDIIERPFKNSYITKLHAYMILGESDGGDTVYKALDGIDYDSWRTDTYIFQTQKYKYQNQNGIYTLLGLGISLAVVFIFQNIIAQANGSLGNVFDDITYQIYTFIYVLIDMVSYILIKTMITSKWVREDE